MTGIKKEHDMYMYVLLERYNAIGVKMNPGNFKIFLHAITFIELYITNKNI